MSEKSKSFMSKPLLTKSKYMLGLQCPTLLWKSVHQKESIPEPDESAKRIFAQGDQVGNLAKKLYPDGIEIKQDDFNQSLKDTKEAIKLRKTLFEASIKEGQLYSRPDILIPVEKDKWDINEIKSSSSVKEEHIKDLAFQRFCYESSGLKIRNCFLTHIDSSYVRHGEIEPKKLLKSEDVTDRVTEEMKGIERRIINMLKILAIKDVPKEVLSKSCTSPYECPLMDDCWEFLPELNIFHLYRGGETAFELFAQGIQTIEDIPSDFKLNPKQAIQQKALKEKKEYINKEKLSAFLKEIKYPAYFLDFETLSSAVPLYDGTSPFQQIPFQFSLHIINKEGEKPKHVSYLAKGDKDPMHEFVTVLKEQLGTKGSIVAFNSGFEKRILGKLSEDFPEHSEWIRPVQARFIDLLRPFQDFYYYHPQQKGSASLKAVLPALTGKSYSGLEIANGDNAALAFLRIIRSRLGEAPLSKEEENGIRMNLEKYCGLDTEAMVLIVDELRKKV